MNQESDDPDDVFMGEVPYDVIYDGMIRVNTAELQNITEDFNKYLKKTEYYEVSITQINNYRNLITFYTNMIQLAKLALMNKIIGNDNYVKMTFDIKKELNNEDCDYAKLAKETTTRLDIIKCKYDAIITNYIRAKREEEQKTK